MFCDDIFGESPAGVRKPVMPVQFLFFNHIPCSVVAIFPFIVDPLPTTKKSVICVRRSKEYDHGSKACNSSESLVRYTPHNSCPCYRSFFPLFFINYLMDSACGFI